MDELSRVADDLADLERQAKEMVFQMANTLSIDLNMAPDCISKQLVAPVDLQKRWAITQADYEELLTAGLPVIRFESGVVRHPEAAVDEFFRQRVAQRKSDVFQESITDRAVTALEQIAVRLPILSGPPMTVEQVAQFSSVSVKTIYRWVGQGKLKPKADGTRPLLFERSEVENALSNKRRT